MNVRVDPRLEERRREVAESNARRRLRRLLGLAILPAVLGAIVWIAQSPWFSVAHVAVSGVYESDAARILEEAGVRAGTPLVSIRAGRVEELLVADPWVAAADVRLVLPDSVEVVVSEHTGVAWLQTGAQWALLAEDATLLRYAPEPAAGDPRLSLAVSPVDVGHRFDDLRVVEGLAFLAALPARMTGEVSLEERNGEMWGVVGDLTVRLGAPVDMGAKAAALVAIVEEGVAHGATVNLVAPTRPAVSDPST